MKKIAILLVIALLAVCFAGCAAEQIRTEAPEAEKIDRAETAAEEPGEAAEEPVTIAVETPGAEAEPEIEEAPKPEPAEKSEKVTKPAEEAEKPAPEEPPEPDAAPVETPAESPAEEQTADPNSIEGIVQQIRADYQAIVFDTNLEVREYTTEATAFLQNGNIVNIIENRQLDDAADPATATVRYYYRGGEPFFVHISYRNDTLDEVRLYFFNGELIRRVFNADAPIDGAFYDEWNAFFDDAIAAYESVQSGL